MRKGGPVGMAVIFTLHEVIVCAVLRIFQADLGQALFDKIPAHHGGFFLYAAFIKHGNGVVVGTIAHHRRGNGGAH